MSVNVDIIAWHLGTRTYANIRPTNTNVASLLTGEKVTVPLYPYQYINQFSTEMYCYTTTGIARDAEKTLSGHFLAYFEGDGTYTDIGTTVSTEEILHAVHFDTSSITTRFLSKVLTDKLLRIQNTFKQPNSIYAIIGTNSYTVFPFVKRLNIVTESNYEVFGTCTPVYSGSKVSDSSITVSFPTTTYAAYGKTYTCAGTSSSDINVKPTYYGINSSSKKVIKYASEDVNHNVCEYLVPYTTQGNSVPVIPYVDPSSTRYKMYSMCCIVSSSANVSSPKFIPGGYTTVSFAGKTYRKVKPDTLSITNEATAPYRIYYFGYCYWSTNSYGVTWSSTPVTYSARSNTSTAFSSTFTASDLRSMMYLKNSGSGTDWEVYGDMYPYFRYDIDSNPLYIWSLGFTTKDTYADTTSIWGYWGGDYSSTGRVYFFNSATSASIAAFFSNKLYLLGQQHPPALH